MAHIGLMCAAIFARNDVSVQGSVIQMFNHGVNIIGLWLAVEIIERQTGIKQISQLGGIATKRPSRPSCWLSLPWPTLPWGR